MILTFDFESSLASLISYGAGIHASVLILSSLNDEPLSFAVDCDRDVLCELDLLAVFIPAYPCITFGKLNLEP